MDHALVFTGHFPDAKRKASIHALSEALLRRGWTLDFVTIGLSPMSRFNRRSLWKHVAHRPVNQWIEIAPGITSYLWKAPFHPVNLRFALLNVLATPVYRFYPTLLPSAVRDRAEKARLILFEGPVSTMLMGMMRALRPDALLIYNAADRLRTLGVHPILSETERLNVPCLDLVRVPAEAMVADYPEGSSVAYLPQGLDKESFAAANVNPFAGTRNAVIAGDMLFDPWVLDVLAVSHPEWHFHLFGVRAVPSVPRENIVVHGEQPFAMVISYLKHADIGVAPYRKSRDAGYLAQSGLKMIEYSYCGLPVVAPLFAAGGRPHVCAYQPGDAESLRQAFGRAVCYDRRMITSPDVPSWDEVLQQMLERAATVRAWRSAHGRGTPPDPSTGLSRGSDAV